MCGEGSHVLPIYRHGKSVFCVEFFCKSKTTIKNEVYLHTYGQQAQEKMLNITNYQRNANQNYNLTPIRTAIIKNLQTTSAGEGVEKREPPTVLVGIYFTTATMVTNMEVPEETKSRDYI